MRTSCWHWITSHGHGCSGRRCTYLLVHTIAHAITAILLGGIITNLVSPYCMTSPETGLYTSRHLLYQLSKQESYPQFSDKLVMKRVVQVPRLVRDKGEGLCNSKLSTSALWVSRTDQQSESQLYQAVSGRWELPGGGGTDTLLIRKRFLYQRVTGVLNS